MKLHQYSTEPFHNVMHVSDKIKSKLTLTIKKHTFIMMVCMSVHGKAQLSLIQESSTKCY